MNGLSALRSVAPCGILSLVHETYNSWGSIACPNKHRNSRRAGRRGDSVGATGAGFGLALPVDGPPETALGKPEL
jgi:hypothetical protein